MFRVICILDKLRLFVFSIYNRDGTIAQEIGNRRIVFGNLYTIDPHVKGELWVDGDVVKRSNG